MLTQTNTIDSSGNVVVSGTVTSNAGTGTQAVSIASMPSTPVTGAFWQATQPVSGTVAVTGALTDTQLRATPVPISGTVSTSAVTSATGTLSSVVGAASSTTLLASNASRKGFTLYNDSTAILKVAFAAAASATAFTVVLQPNSFFENSTLYTGIITGIWASATGNARVTELT